MVNFVYVNYTSIKKRKNWVFVMGLLDIWLANPTQGKSMGGIELH